MQVTYDPAKRKSNVVKHGLDLDWALEVFEGPTLDIPDTRKDYGEDRIVSVGHLEAAWLSQSGRHVATCATSSR